MKQLTQKQIEKLNKISVECLIPNKNNELNHLSRALPLGFLVDEIIKILNEEKTPRKKKETSTNDTGTV